MAVASPVPKIFVMFISGLLEGRATPADFGQAKGGRWRQILPGSNGSRARRSGGSGRGRDELHRHAIHAVAQAGGRRSVLEDVAEMAAAAPAMHLGARHQEDMVGR